ncbi:hypothetical protein [Clavibacter michiganensis]|uniref:Uncharacterized protein n=1 Tax=Clavibacter michiganensis subsp. insidiosus TaxID=33014 RepID=A0A0D5CGR4_9MICO|nr:hypothetical protein [Clavibacter michiganensis]AJW78485.1 hypothetical protein VO01_04455 [Clavibacter michiganensis subsp. insidiosus]AWF98888.1 hypothetical protein BEH61_10270 [Clavibacter michiganensis subsp. insidiosus]AWG00890.1 hypothetical protein BEH62_04675 [Clavibacter michiganensis subsp. insidiosus]OQJ60523.1 hypothetical protein B5P21_11850 [Clavibacter michiganensis subsp. insidiosus]RII89035.1 hypothetical protein DZF92_00680 [Clavibacter michiganensis subsp. insidiosus]
MPIENLDSTQGLVFVGEITSTRNLLASGLRILREGAFFDTTKDPIFTTLSIGVEKYLKLILGTISLDEHQRWPSKAEMMGYGHGIAEMWDRVMDEVHRRTEDKSEYIRGLDAGVDVDPVLRPLLEVLDRYGRSGRFYNLDALGGRPQEDLSPDEMFNAVEQAALADPEVSRARDEAMADLFDQVASDQFDTILRERIASSLDGAWQMLSRVGMNDGFGETGKVLGYELRAADVGDQ